jgi:hypothetical protein
MAPPDQEGLPGGPPELPPLSRHVWEAERTDKRERKRLLRCLIEEVQLRTEAQRYRVLILWKGGAATEREVVRRSAGGAISDLTTAVLLTILTVRSTA